MATTEIVGRHEELASIDAFLAELERGPRALVLAGDAGIGKTILWKAGVEAAERRFERVLICRGVEAEAALSFAGLSELLTPVLEDTLPVLASPRRRALEVALLLVEPGDLVPDAHAIGLAVLDILHVLTARAPVLIALDDLQWLDRASAGVLQVALRRLHDEPIGLLATIRESGDADSAPIEFEHCFEESQLARVPVGPLSLAALHRLLKERLGLELSRPELARVQETTAANPFFALELGRELERQGARIQPGQPLPLPGGLAKLLGGRLARLSPETRQVLLLAASAGRPTTAVIVAAQGDREEALAALDEASREGVVEVVDERVQFVHPLFASAIYEQVPSRDRRQAHRALGWTVTDPEERALHLARAADGPDAVVAAELDLAARHAAARGAPGAGAELYELAAALTPDDPATARERRLGAARCHRVEGDAGQAIAILEQLLAEGPAGVQRSDILFELARMFTSEPRRMLELCHEALDLAGDDDARAIRIIGVLVATHLWEARGDEALADARVGLEKAERIGDPGLLAVAIARLGVAENYAAQETPGLLERGAEIEDRFGLELEYSESPRFSLARTLIRDGELDRARTLLDDGLTKATARGDAMSRVMNLWTLGQLEWFAGRWARSLEHATAAHELGEQSPHEHSRSYVARVKALVETDLGRLDEARASAAESLRYAQAASNAFFTICARGALGRIELAAGDLEAASRHLRELPEQLMAGDMVDPILNIWPDTVEMLIATGELDLARTYAQAHESYARRHRSPWGLAAAARGHGLLAAGEGDLAAAIAILDGLLVDLGGLSYPFERGRALLASGSVRRHAQQKQAARAALEEALTVFEGLGARLWAGKAQAELRRISGRQPASSLLTETERQVATLAAQGRTNSEIAAALYLGVSTVEAHLSHVYRKVGVRRAELGSWLASGDDAANTTD